MWTIQVSLILSFLCGRGLGGAARGECEWGVSLCEIGDPLNRISTCNFESPLTTLSGGIEMQQFSTKVQDIIKTLTDQPVNTQESTTSYLGFPYYLRIDLLCGSKESSKRAIREALLTGLTPNVVLTFQEPVHPIRLKSQRLQIILTTAPLLDSVPCDSDLCQLGWYAPMPILNGSVVYRVQVVSNGQGQLVPERSFAVNVNGYVRTTDRGETEISFGTEMPALEDMMVLGSPSRPLWAVVQSSPVLILPGIPGFKAVLMTATEFQHTSPIEVGIESCWAGSLNCPQVEFSSMILEAISTESSLFIRQNQLLHRFVGNFSLLPLRAPPSEAWQQVLRTVCVSRMVPVFIPYHGTEYFYILGGGWQKGTLYRAQVYDGDVTFTQLLDSKGSTACEFMNSKACQVKWAAQDSSHNHLIDLVLLELLPDNKQAHSYHLLILDNDFHLGDTLPKYIPKGSGDSFTVVTKTQENVTVTLHLRGMVFNPISAILYIWGNALLCSQDQGMSYLFFNGFPLDQMIKYFTLSYHGEFAFVTETEELWWGQEGVDQVMRVRPSLGWQAFSSLQALKGDSSYSMTHSLLTVFYDWDKQLQEVVYTVDSKGKGSVVKRELPVPEILSYSHFSTTPRKVHHLESFSAFSFPLTCPFFWEHMADLPHPEPYNRIQQYLTRPPLVPTSLGLQTTASLATYQGLLHHLLQLHSDYIMDIGDPVHNPTWRWWKDKVIYADYYFYMASNGVSSTGFNVEIGGYSRAYMSSEITFPDMVYLDRVSSFSFSIYIACGSAKHLSVEEKPRELSDINYIWLSAEVSNNRYIHVSVTRNELFNRGAVLYKVTVKDRGLFPGQVLAGEGLLAFNLLLRVSSSEMKCYQQKDQGIALRGLHRVPIYIGCPPGNRLAFDITTTLEQCANNNKRYFNCPKPDPIMPCFYYEDLFYPFFLIQDMVSGESERFLGSYTFKVVGGGAYSKDHIRLYTPEEVLMYNSLNYSSQRTLVWMFEDMDSSVNITKEGFVVMHGNTNKIRWMCQGKSPCGNMAAQSLEAPDYYFVIEVSNKGIDLSTYCDYALRFILHVHGFPLDPSRGLFYMLMTLATIVGILFCFIVYNCCGPGLKNLLKAAYHATKHRSHAVHESDVSLAPSIGDGFHRSRDSRQGLSLTSTN
ncbi:cation channel sperm-associated auxiliary subunit gamma-like isoform X1 [Oncorhynchus keta]|uniref:cation channel sperm-associated auxiliary subunit gamma-like isoform X1 n=2 Tax=Oncorhynchus keta TaxID=8018 RepID=UPI0015FC1E35|nr:cation channel sperm-associated auxiliary subunit gamma-like isoform X1 [Oncorhynchus keta]